MTTRRPAPVAKRRLVTRRWTALLLGACLASALAASAASGAALSSSSTPGSSPPSGPATARRPFRGGGNNSTETAGRATPGVGHPPFRITRSQQQGQERRSMCRYRWRAALDVGTGVASSHESSAAPVPSRLHRSAASRASTTTDVDSLLLRWTEDWARRYPAWLCSGPVTFGLLRAVPVPDRANRDGRTAGGPPAAGAVEIRTRLGNLHLLSFGPTRNAQRITYYRGRGDVVDGDDIRNGIRDDDDVITCRCTVVLPVTGGILALPPPLPSSQKAHERGAMLLSVQKKTTERRPRVAGGPEAKVVEEVQEDPTKLELHFTTALTGYRPWLAGRRLPVPGWRRALYLTTQSAVHALVMWRYHRHGRDTAIHPFDDPSERGGDRSRKPKSSNPLEPLL